MSQDPAPKPASKGDEALVVWMKLAGLLVGLAAFGAVIFWLSRMINAH